MATVYVLFLFASGQSPGVAGRPHGAIARRLDGATGQELLHGPAEWELPCRYLVHDRDPNFMALDGVLKTDELRILKTPPQSPRCNAFAERHVRELGVIFLRI